MTSAACGNITRSLSRGEKKTLASTKTMRGNSAASLDCDLLAPLNA